VHKRDQIILLPPSLCHEAALPKDFTKDAFKMRELHNFKISNPDERAQRIGNLMDVLGKNEVYSNWNIKAAPNMAQVRGKKLYPAKLKNDRNFDDYVRGKVKLEDPIELKYNTWALLYPANCF
jgi:hypothetical protein